VEEQEAMILALMTCIFAIDNQAKPTLTETQKIELLIKHVRELKDAKFVRNGTAYDAKAAAEHLRKKWDYAKKEIKTARDFIAKIATESYVGKQPYLIRFPDGREVKAGEYLADRLKEFENPKKP
jgi:hypothetical protein